MTINASDDDDYSKYSVNWKKEVVYILRAIMEKGELLTAHFDHGKNFILTSIVGVDAEDDEVYLDVGANAAMNERIVDSDKIIFITTHDKVKVQFTAGWIEKTQYDGRDSFRIELPESLIKLQRREFYRVTTPISKPLKCLAPTENGEKMEMTVVDISIGGIGVILPSLEIELDPGKTFTGCHLELPEIGVITAKLQLRTLFEVTLRNGQKNKRAGFQFVDLPANMQSMIQRYIIKMERERRAMQLDRE